MPKFAWLDRLYAVSGAAKELNDYVKANGKMPSDGYIKATLE